MKKSDLTERDICSKFVTPALQRAGWDLQTQIGEERTLTDRSKNYPNRNEYQPSGIAWINTGHIQPNGSLDLSGMHYISREKFDTLRSGKIQPGDLVYCLRGATFGKTGFVEPFTEGAIASSLMIIRLKPGFLDRQFAYTLLMSPYGKEQLLRFDNGTAQPNLSAGNVRKYLIPLPPLAEQHRIVAKVDALMALCDGLEAALTTTDTTPHPPPRSPPPRGAEASTGKRGSRRMTSPTEKFIRVYEDLGEAVNRRASATGSHSFEIETAARRDKSVANRQNILRYRRDIRHALHAAQLSARVNQSAI